MLDLIYKHIFSDSRFIDIEESESVAIEAAIKYYTTVLLGSTPYLFLYYFDKLENFEIENTFISKYCFIVALLQLTVKWAEDKYYYNVDICKMFFSTLMTIENFNKLERTIFAALDYNLYISQETYIAYTDTIISKYLTT